MAIAPSIGAAIMTIVATAWKVIVATPEASLSMLHFINYDFNQNFPV